jgi:hypothetical protein
MKKHIIGLLALAALFISNTAIYSQDFKTLSPVTIISNTTGVMSEKVWATFQKEFKEAQNVTWYKNDKNYVIKFVLNEIAHQILYNAKGQKIYHLRYVEEPGLPADLVKLLKTTYRGFAIKLGIHIQQHNQSIWVMNLENSQHLIFVRVENGETEVVNELEYAYAN